MARQRVTFSNIDEITAQHPKSSGSKSTADSDTTVLTIKLPAEQVDRVENALCQLTGRQRGVRRPRGFGQFVSVLLDYALDGLESGDLQLELQPTVVEFRPARSQ